MKKSTLLSTLMLLVAANIAFAQNAKKTPPPAGKTFDATQTHVAWPGKNTIPAAENPFGIGDVNYQPIPSLTVAPKAGENIKLLRGENGLPIFFKGKTAASTPTAGENNPITVRATNYLASLRPESIQNPAAEFVAGTVETDAQNGAHVRMQQMYQGIPVFGGEVIAHAKAGVFEMLNGRYFPTPTVPNLTPALSAADAYAKSLETLAIESIKTTWTPEELALVGGQKYKANLVIYHANDDLNGEKLVWEMTVRPNLLSRLIFFVDAQSGEIINKIDHTCNFTGQCSAGHGVHALPTLPTQNSVANEPTEFFNGPVTCSGLDLLDQNRSFGGYQVGTKYYMEDASKAMFNASASTFPDEPVGAIVTLDAFNTSPVVQSSFNYDVVNSNTTTFTNKKSAVSAHWNSGKCYDYFKTTFNRNSINGEGGNILAFANVSEDDGSSMENAFWNGDAMWYGNGGSSFKPLARGLDVGGHEMTHGVIEKTANLVYQNESGALNESFADIFGAMIDRDDWKMGEDVMQAGVHPALRDLSDPHNGASSSSPWWQPKNMSEKYNGTQDNGGVHINSGIVNYAFYLFTTASGVGKEKAEQVYYKALKDYLVKSSKFVDCRIAVIQAATDLYGTTVANAAATAFSTVGIGGAAPSGNYLGQLQPNPGDDYILVTSEDYNKLDLALGNGQVLGNIYDGGLKSRPSVTDNGSQIVFVNAIGHIIGVDMVYTATDIIPTVNPPLSSEPIWRNAAISKDGRFIAALTDNQDNKIYIFDLNSISGANAAFFLYNPTYTNGQQTNDVDYADVLEFDFSGRNLMYDARTKVVNNQGDDLSYWDIGFLKFWDGNGFTDGNGDISKLFNGLPEQTSVGNPSFAKNSPFIIAFDVIDGLNNQYDVFGANVETGDNGAIVPDNGDLGYPNFNRLDNGLIYESDFSVFGKSIYLQGLASSKIAPQGNAAELVSEHIWGIWYADGNRSLMVSADEPNARIALAASPNPVTDALRIEFASKSTTAARITVLNMLGETVRSLQTTLYEGNNTLSVDMQDLPAGAYFVRLDAGKMTATAKVVKK